MLNKPIISLQPFQQKESRTSDGCFLAECSQYLENLKKNLDSVSGKIKEPKKLWVFALKTKKKNPWYLWVLWVSWVFQDNFLSYPGFPELRGFDGQRPIS